MYPWRRILVPTDFSTASAWVFGDAVRIAGATGAEIVILHVRMTRTSNPGELRFPAAPALYEYAEQIELEKLRERVRSANAAIATRLIVRQAPDPGAEICRTATDEGIDLIVMATHARHHVAHLFLGSTTLDVLTNAHVPILAIHYGTHIREGMRRIVVPVYPQQERDGALRLARSVAEWERGRLALVTVCDEKAERAAETHLDELARAHAAGIPVETSVLVGSDVDREVLRHISRTDADALFINSDDEPGPLKIALIRHSPVPVMIVPA